jgi:hypothetical protein
VSADLHSTAPGSSRVVGQIRGLDLEARLGEGQSGHAGVGQAASSPVLDLPSGESAGCVISIFEADGVRSAASSARAG